MYSYRHDHIAASDVRPTEDRVSERLEEDLSTLIWRDKCCPECWRKTVGFDTGYCRRCKKLTCEPFSINAVCEPIVSAHIRAVALLTMTNAEDWNYRFLLFDEPPQRRDLLHASQRWFPHTPGLTLCTCLPLSGFSDGTTEAGRL